jgi:hypothetical protein
MTGVCLDGSGQVEPVRARHLVVMEQEVVQVPSFLGRPEGANGFVA